MCKRAAWYSKAHLKHVWKKTSPVHHLESMLTKCRSAFLPSGCGSVLATFISHCAILDHMWTEQILKASSKIWHVQTLKSLSSLATSGPHPLPPCTTITRIYSSQGPNPGAVSTPITVKLSLYQLWWSSILVESSFNSREELGVKNSYPTGTISSLEDAFCSLFWKERDLTG